MRRALITGATGFVGRHLINELRQSGWSITALLRNPSPLPPDVATIRADLQNLQPSDLRSLRVDAVFHLAGISNVDVSGRNPDIAFRVNVLGTSQLYAALDGARLRPRVLFVSSGNVYPASPRPLDEASPLLPGNVYAASKACAEGISRAWLKRGMDILFVRPFNHIGPGQSVDFVAPSIAEQIARAEAGLAEPLIRVGHLSPVRDFTDVRDIVRAYRLAVEHGETGDAYNVSSDHGITIRTVAAEFIRQAKIPVRIVQEQGRRRNDPHSVRIGCSRRMRALTGWKPSIPLQRTVADILEHHRRAVAAAPGAPGVGRKNPGHPATPLTVFMGQP